MIMYDFVKTHVLMRVSSQNGVVFKDELTMSARSGQV